MNHANVDIIFYIFLFKILWLMWTFLGLCSTCFSNWDMLLIDLIGMFHLT